MNFSNYFKEIIRYDIYPVKIIIGENEYSYHRYYRVPIYIKKRYNVLKFDFIENTIIFFLEKAEEYIEPVIEIVDWSCDHENFICLVRLDIYLEKDWVLTVDGEGFHGEKSMIKSYLPVISNCIVCHHAYTQLQEAFIDGYLSKNSFIDLGVYYRIGCDEVDWFGEYIYGGLQKALGNYISVKKAKSTKYI